MARRYQEQQLKQSLGISADEPKGKLSKVETLAEIALDEKFGGIFSLQYNFDGSHVVAGFGHGCIRMFDSKSGEMLKELRPHRHGGDAIMCMRFHPTEPSKLYATTAEGHVYLFNTDSGDFQHIITEAKNEINTMDFSADGFCFATSGKDLAVRVYKTKTNEMMQMYKGYGATDNPAEEAGRWSKNEDTGNTMRVFCLKFHPDKDNIFITSGWDNHIKIWDIQTNDGIKRQIHGPHVCGDGLDIQGNRILSGSWCANHALQEWDYGEGKLVKDIKFPNKNGAFLYCAQYANYDTVLAGGSGTDSVEILDRGDNKHIGGVQLTKPVQALDSANGGRLFAVGGADKVIKLCALK